MRQFHKVSRYAPSAAASRKRAQRSTTGLRVLRIELREYGHRLADLPRDSEHPRSDARDDANEELAQLAFTRTFVAGTLRRAQCEACERCGTAECPLARLWQQTRDRIEELELHVKWR